MVDLDWPQVTIQHMCFACQIAKAVDTHSICQYLLLFHGSSGYTNVLHCYIICTLQVLLQKTCTVLWYCQKQVIMELSTVKDVNSIQCMEVNVRRDIKWNENDVPRSEHKLVFQKERLLCCRHICSLQLPRLFHSLHSHSEL